MLIFLFGSNGALNGAKNIMQAELGLQPLIEPRQKHFFTIGAKYGMHLICLQLVSKHLFFWILGIRNTEKA